MESCEQFCVRLTELSGLSPLWKKVLGTLEQIQSDLPDAAKTILIIYFSLLDDGNTCIPLEKSALMKKWSQKWNGLLLADCPDFPCEPDEASNQDDKNADFSLDFFERQIEAGIPLMTENRLPLLIGKSRPFVVDNGWLFAAKYHKAKLSIENRIKTIFDAEAVAQSAGKSDEGEKIRQYFKKITGQGTSGGIDLKARQVDAIARGQNENLIITGGPGTGKTTVVCYLLWELLKKSDYIDCALFLAAPSGKAADRMKESIADTLGTINREEREKFMRIFDKLNNAQSFTIHRLLSYRPDENRFAFGADNQFDRKSIFVIDEASMIDISLFSALLEAIPQGARVFILGDKNQLPSVQAGAVLGELLAQKTGSVVALTESNRFSDNSEVGHLKNAMQSENPLDKSLANLCDWETWKSERFSQGGQCLFPAGKNYPVRTLMLRHDFAAKKIQTKEIVTGWSRCFYDALCKDALITDETNLDALWSRAVHARILCAERRGIHGVQEINAEICRHIRKNLTDKSAADEYFAGELLILTKNQAIFNLYNGDSGIVVAFRQKNPDNPDEPARNLKYLMVRKEAKSDGSADSGRSGGILRRDNFLFYPLHLLPAESLECAYAITIHKSQGSGYKSILIFLPDVQGHPLLNRQIAYTAITRTQGETYIVARAETLEQARKNVIHRDTGILMQGNAAEV